jgi:hypothetical protein
MNICKIEGCENQQYALNLCHKCYKREYDRTHLSERTDYNREWREKNPEHYIFNKAKTRARKCGFEFNIEVSDIIIPKYCPILGIELKFEKRDTHGGPRDWPNSPSLDRIDNTKGYIKGNIMVISCRANVLKSDGTPEEFRKLYNFFKGGALHEEDCHYW